MKNLLLVLVGLLILTSCNDNIEYIATLQEGITLRDTNIARLETMITLYQAKCDNKTEEAETKRELIEQRIHLTTKRYEAITNYEVETLLDVKRFEVLKLEREKYFKDYVAKFLSMKESYEDFTKTQKKLNIGKGSVDNQVWLKKIHHQVIKIERVKLDLEELPRIIELRKLKRKNEFDSRLIRMDQHLKIINYKLDLIAQKEKANVETQVKGVVLKAHADSTLTMEQRVNRAHMNAILRSIDHAYPKTTR